VDANLKIATMRTHHQLSVLLAASFLSVQQTLGATINGKAPSAKAAVTPYEIVDPPLDTQWTRQVKSDQRWTSYPRPQLQRSDWQSLNGIWKWQDYRAKASRGNDVSMVPKESFDREVLVPSCLESGLSGELFIYAQVCTDHYQAS
jgi:hypothetical protein